MKLIVLLSFLFSHFCFAIEWKNIDPKKDILIIRHALAPGTGDPDNFKLNDCSTQRNLNLEGKKQARKLGKHIKSNYAGKTLLLTSQWCRCRETANLMDMGTAQDFPKINSFFRQWEKEKTQMRSFKQWLKNYDGNKLPVMITHQVVMTALTGAFPNSGEIFWVRNEKGSFVLKGRERI